MAEKHFFWMSYHAPQEAGKKLPPHQVRDGAAFAELSGLFHLLGYQYGGTFFNPPAIGRPRKPKPGRLRRPVKTHRPHLLHRSGCQADWDFLTEDDVLVLSTRPPLDDERRRDRKKIHRSFEWLECQVLLALDPFLKVCARSHVEIGPAFAKHFRDGYGTRRRVTYHQYPWAQYKVFRSVGAGVDIPAPKAPFLTAGYLIAVKIQTPELPDGPRVVAAFGMGGTETLIWAHLLRCDVTYRKWMGVALAAPEGRVLMAEIRSLTPPPQKKFFTTKFATDWTAEIILDAPS